MYTASSRLADPRRFLVEAGKDLLGCLAIARRILRQNLARQYRYSLLGPLWALGPPILTAAALSVGIRRSAGVASLDWGGVPPAAHAVFGLTMAQIFIDSFNLQRTCFAQVRPLFNRQTPRIEALILANLAEAGLTAFLRILVLLAVLVFFRVPLGPTSVAATAGFLFILMLGAGLGLLAAPWNAFSRDVDRVLGLSYWFLFITTPIFIPMLTTGLGGALHRANPLSYVFATTRFLAYGGGAPSVLFLGVAGLAPLLLVCGWLLCRLCLPYVAERDLS